MAAAYVLCLVFLLLVITHSSVANQQVIHIDLLLLQPADLTTAITAARYAADAINRDGSILPLHHLQLVTVDAGGCGEQNDNYNSLVEFISVLESSVEVVGVVGPFCGYHQETNDLLFRTIESVGIPHISGSLHPLLTGNGPTSPASLFPNHQTLISAVLCVLEHFGWHRIGLIHGTDRLSSETSSLLAESSVEVVSTLITSSELSIPCLIQELQEHDVTVLLLSMPLNQLYRTICYVFKYQPHLMRPSRVWVVYGHWFDDIINEHTRSTSWCNATEIEQALEGLILLNPHLEPEDVSDVIVSGETYHHYTTNVLPSNSTVSEQFRANLVYDSVWAIALTLSLKLNCTEQSGNTTFVKDKLTCLEFNGSSGSRDSVWVDITHVSGGIPTNVGCYKNGSVYVNTSLFGFVPADSLPQVQVGLSLRLVVFFSIASTVIEDFTIVLTFLYFYFRNEPEIKATSPPLSVLAFIGLHMMLVGAEVLVLASNDYASTPLCVSVLWLINHGDALYVITLLVKVMRIYRVFSYFGRTGQAWSNVVLFVLIIGFLLVVTVNITLWSVFGMPTAVTNERVIDGKVLVETFCDYGNISIWPVICISYITALRAVLVILAIMTRKIRRQHFKDTKKVNILVYIYVPIAAVFTVSSFVTTDRTLRTVVDYVVFVSLVILYMVLLVIPKVWPPCKRKIFGELKTSRANSSSGQMLNAQIYIRKPNEQYKPDKGASH